MKAEAIAKAMANAEGRGMATDALSGLPEGGQPAELPAQPETEAMGPPETIPPVETGEAPEFDEATGLPLIAMEKTPDAFPGDADTGEEADDVLDFLFS